MVSTRFSGGVQEIRYIVRLSPFRPLLYAINSCTNSDVMKIGAMGV
jgi:hypothetical protein